MDLELAWSSGHVCLHAADTLPGISCDPSNSEAWSQFLTLKSRDPEKTPISLVSDSATALRFWDGFPRSWANLLDSIWPGPVSIVWKASGSAPRALVSRQGTIALRCPNLICPGQDELKEFLKKLDRPFPSTSVNCAGEPAARSWLEAKAILKDLQAKKPKTSLWIPADPKHEGEQVKFSSEGSSIIEVTDEFCYKILRSTKEKDWEYILSSRFKRVFHEV